MKYVIASDLHGSALYTKTLLESVEREAADRLLLLGTYFITDRVMNYRQVMTRRKRPPY